MQIRKRCEKGDRRRLPRSLTQEPTAGGVSSPEGGQRKKKNIFQKVINEEGGTCSQLRGGDGKNEKKDTKNMSRPVTKSGRTVKKGNSSENF